MLFDSEIEEKRIVLKNILHKIYANMVSKRKLIRKVATKFLKHHSVSGTSDILDFYASIIKGFQTPLNDEKLSFFMDILIPLHKKPNCEVYFEKLVKCCLIYLDKEETLAIALVEANLVYFPHSIEFKERLFLTEMIEIFSTVKIEKYATYFNKLIPYLLEIMAKCLTTESLFPFAIKLLLEDSFLALVEIYKKECFTVLVPLFGGSEGESQKGGTLISQNSTCSLDNPLEMKVNEIIDTINLKLKLMDAELYNENIKLLESSELDKTDI
jgi:serine/threonine-protein phosphatase 2A regulatory subunit B'